MSKMILSQTRLSETSWMHFYQHLQYAHPTSKITGSKITGSKITGSKITGSKSTVWKLRFGTKFE